MISFKNFLNESINDEGIFKAIFIVGIPGAGKSYTASKLSGKISPRIVNTDRATEYLIRKSGQMVSHKNWPKFQDDTHRITRGALTNYLNSVLPLFIDGTSNDASNILHRSGILESLGYDIGMVFIDTPLETALDRAATRTEREVDPEFIKAVNDQAAENLHFFKSKFQFFKIIKNGDGELTDEILNNAFKAVQSFYDKPIENPVGKRMLADMKEHKAKYLTDIMPKDILTKKVEGWYRT